MKAIVDGGHVPGLLAYARDVPVGWCSIAPREQLPVLQRSRTLKPVEDTPIWSEVCFFVDKSYRRSGLSERLLLTAVEVVKEQGDQVVEGYPVEPKTGRMPAVHAFTGLSLTFEKAGFVECLRRSPSSPIMRLCLGNPSRGGSSRGAT